jgi:hypothetical protein
VLDLVGMGLFDAGSADVDFSDCAFYASYTLADIASISLRILTTINWENDNAVVFPVGFRFGRAFNGQGSRLDQSGGPALTLFK